jgi:malate dehydrogenase (oxaloacetate-decarboxylating)(NADP+)
VKLVNTGGGAAALACLDLLVERGLRRENVTVCDIEGVVYQGRTSGMDPYKARYARATEARGWRRCWTAPTSSSACPPRACSSPNGCPSWRPKPLVLALANPDPEILPEAVRAARPDAIVATGRSDYPNQVNNVLCFPFIFRGALDVGATAINEAMKIAAAEAIARLARVEASEVVAAAYGGNAPVFGPEYIIPKPFDPRLILEIAPAVGPRRDGERRRPPPHRDFAQYRRELERFVFRTGYLMRPIFEAARQSPMRVAYSKARTSARCAPCRPCWTRA